MAAERASALATALGGDVWEVDGGRVVVVDREMSLAFDEGTLEALPYPFDARRPVVCLDTETTGLGTGTGTVPFLVGMGLRDGYRFRVRQLLLPDHADEAAFLRAVERTLPAEASLVTYNGRSFDWPLLVSRYRLHRQPVPAPSTHLDLLAVARQVWRHRLPDARLATVEAGIAGVRRPPDLPGALIPARYFAFLRSGRAALLHDVVQHNRQDVASLARLLRALGELARGANGGQPQHAGDLAGLARAFRRAQRLAEALVCLDAALRDTRLVGGTGGLARDRLHLERARTLSALGRRAEAVESWLEVADGGRRLSAQAWIHIAKYREHAEGDISGALAAAERAALGARRARLTGWPILAVEADLPPRLARLRLLLNRGRRAGAAPLG